MRLGLELARFAVLFTVVSGHARFIQPPSRSSMWRYGFDNPKNTNDQGANCGGVWSQWNVHGGKCGICGDSLSDPPPRANEAGGKYGNGIIVANYKVGETIQVISNLTANHLGHMQYRLCQNDDPKATLEQDCFDKHLLTDESGQTNFKITGDMKTAIHYIKLPSGLRCTACVLQWRYTAGNNWGKFEWEPKGCKGCASCACGQFGPRHRLLPR